MAKGKNVDASKPDLIADPESPTSAEPASPASTDLPPMCAKCGASIAGWTETWRVCVNGHKINY